MTEDRREVPLDVTYFRLNSDGSCAELASQDISVYIPVEQAPRLGDIEVVNYIRENFGCFVGVMHSKVIKLTQPAYPTKMYVLGR